MSTKRNANDVILASEDAIWFTDPIYGIMTNYEGKRADSEQPGCMAYRVSADGNDIQAVISCLIKLNGLAFSPDEKTLYVADPRRSHDDNGVRQYLVSDLELLFQINF